MEIWGSVCICKSGCTPPESQTTEDLSAPAAKYCLDLTEKNSQMVFFIIIIIIIVLHSSSKDFQSILAAMANGGDNR